MISKLYTAFDLPIFFLDKCGRNREGEGGRGEYASAKWTREEKENESPPRFGLGTINIATFMEGLICY